MKPHGRSGRARDWSLNRGWQASAACQDDGRSRISTTYRGLQTECRRRGGASGITPAPIQILPWAYSLCRDVAEGRRSSQPMSQGLRGAHASKADGPPPAIRWNWPLEGPVAERRAALRQSGGHSDPRNRVIPLYVRCSLRLVDLKPAFSRDAIVAPQPGPPRWPSSRLLSPELSGIQEPLATHQDRGAISSSR